MSRRVGKHAVSRVRERRTPVATTAMEVCAHAPEIASTADTDGELVRFEGGRGEHVMKDHVIADVPRGAHVKQNDPFLSVERRALHSMHGHVPSDVPRGAHVKQNDPFLSVERRALHLMKVPDFATLGVSVSTSESILSADDILDVDVPSAVELGVASPVHRVAAPRTRRSRLMRQGVPSSASRRWRLVPVAGAAGALVAGLGGGAAFAFFSGGPGTGDVATGSPVTLDAVATTGSADLLPGEAGAVSFTVHNPNTFGASFAQVAPGATVVSDNTGLCPSADVSIAQTLPYTFSPAITVSSGSTSGQQSIPSFVELAPNAPGTCQGVTFTVTFKLSGQSS
jgi:hypothetical protein